MSHYIRTIHTSFTSGIPSASSSSWTSSSPYTSSPSSSSTPASRVLSLGGNMNKYPPGLGYSDWRSPSAGSSPYTFAKRRTAVSMRASASASSSSRRPAPPPPPSQFSRVQPASTTYLKFDPFADENAAPSSSPTHPHHLRTPTHESSVLYHTRSRPASLSYTIELPDGFEVTPPPPPPRFDREARARLVAGILLNRVTQASGKPMRRGPRSGAEPRPYVKSGLSRVVSVEA